ncbi:hypothetical protein B0H19DRAFT_1227254 [Mycena capillaripes]|nr:hypothetical protein B0H19DRAFT_1227254 [Mycena capillaripes]
MFAFPLRRVAQGRSSAGARYCCRCIVWGLHSSICTVPQRAVAVARAMEVNAVAAFLWAPSGSSFGCAVGIDDCMLGGTPSMRNAPSVSGRELQWRWDELRPAWRRDGGVSLHLFAKPVVCKFRAPPPSLLSHHQMAFTDVFGVTSIVATMPPGSLNSASWWPSCLCRRPNMSSGDATYLNGQPIG